MKSFSHINARTVGEAIRFLRKYRGRAKLIAGGTDLLCALKDRIFVDYPEVIINLKTVKGLEKIEENKKGLKIGSMTRLEDIACSTIVNKRYKILSEAASSVGTPQIRRMGTIGGNLCQDIRCWYYRYPHHVGGRILCYMKGGKSCYALRGENQYHSIFGGIRVTDPPCSLACPGGIDIASYIEMIREGNIYEAGRIILQSNPFPSITGRVCPHLCEKNCNRSDFDEPVSIRAVERFIGDYILDRANEFIKPPDKESGKRIAIIGCGPAGLSSAYYLRVRGHKVVIFERMYDGGGMLTYGIPPYRLPKGIVKNVIKMVEDMGVQLKFGIDVGRDIKLDEIIKGFDCLFLATGAWMERRLGLEDEGLTDSGIEFLREINLGKRELPGERVIVIGGGNVAIDSARTALRLGSKDVCIVYRRSIEEMPALEEEIEASREEGVRFYFLTAPIRIIKEKGKVSGIECIRTELGEPDENGRRRPIPVEGSEFIIKGDRIISAIGAEPGLSYLENIIGTTSKGTIDINPETLSTNIDGIFAGGDATTGASTVIEAISAGRRAAHSIDLYLKGMNESEKNGRKNFMPLLRFNPDVFNKMERVKLAKRPVKERGLDIEDSTCIGQDEVKREVNRCFNCGCLTVNSSDIAVSLLALDARLKISGSGGIRIISIEEFFNKFRNTLNEDDIITDIHIPRPNDNSIQRFIKFRLRKAVDFAIVSVGAVIHCEDGICKDIRIAIGSVAPRPIRLKELEEQFIGKPLDKLDVEGLGEIALKNAIPLKMNGYKIEIAKTIIKRAILPY